MFVTHGSVQPPVTPSTLNGVLLGMLHHLAPFMWNSALHRPGPLTQSAAASAQPWFSLTNVRSRTLTLFSVSAPVDCVVGEGTEFTLAVCEGCGDTGSDAVPVPLVAGPFADVCRLSTPAIAPTT